MRIFIEDNPSTAERPGLEYRFVCGHTAEPKRIAAIAAEVIRLCPETDVTVHRTLEDGCRELFVNSYFRADTHAAAVERAEELAGELLCDTGIETVCWGLHVADAKDEMIACDE
jgi:hypothetical protein